MNDYLRELLDDFISQYGSTNAFIAKQIGVSTSLIVHFRKRRRNLGTHNIEKLNKFLTANNN
jgi:antitoxin component HigA of HigAB toxin-antitoxin module